MSRSPRTELRARLLELCEEFRACAIKECLGQLDRVNIEESASNASAFIAQVARVDFRPLVVAARFIRVSDRVISYGDRHATTVEAQYQDVRPDQQVDRLLEEFDRMNSKFDEIQANGK